MGRAFCSRRRSSRFNGERSPDSHGADLHIYIYTHLPIVYTRNLEPVTIVIHESKPAAFNHCQSVRTRHRYRVFDALVVPCYLATPTAILRRHSGLYHRQSRFPPASSACARISTLRTLVLVGPGHLAPCFETRDVARLRRGWIRFGGW